MNPPRISVWTWNLPFIALTLMIHAAAIVVMATSLMRAGANVAKCEVDRFFGAATMRDFEGPAGAILYSMAAPTMHGESGRRLQRSRRLMDAREAAKGMALFRISMGFFAAVLGEFWVKLCRFLDRPLGELTR
jgi:hypothetical protein